MANGDQSFYELGTSTLPALTDAHYNALWFKYKAIQSLSHALNDANSYKQDTLVAGAFLLIFLDLLESGSDKWNIHLEGVKKLITQIQPSMESQTGTEQGLGDTVEGIPWASDITQLHTHSTQDTTMLSMMAESYKAGALIYGRRVLDALTGNMTPLSDLVRELITIIEAMRCDEALFKCILWPMFVAGLESRQQDQRDFVIGCLEKFWFETKCINVVNAANILKRFWRMEDTQQTLSSQWIFNIGQLGRDWLLI
ncbi:unnamed protein product [Aspergillus oryzae var. brunneus]|uniref:Unnamed protein product n=2 Tax=Aspergillus oryzae TaxID=5062 RepID=A0AAN4YR32_ASPOZ|nr:unnamed protein product [Aspergillus oryzae]GMG34676.1 unnamed protein product [Aspergillus oryzae]GMG46439.1 unnamed protein product [Aspergillus oryzae var. brunneus]